MRLKEAGVARQSQARRANPGHEGAKESTTPGAPREREVITPDWAHLDKDAASQCVPDDSRSNVPSGGRTPPAGRVKGPAIDRHR
jgi:hypothetical protein